MWRKDVTLRARFPDLSALTLATEGTLAASMPAEVARDLMAYLRRHPDAVQADKPIGLNLVRLQLRESLAAASANDRTNAARLALSAYLDGFEPLEPMLRTRNQPLLNEVESAMLEYRSSLTHGTVDQVNLAAGALEPLLAQVEQELDQGHIESTSTFIGALTILLREGVEALLIVVGMIAFLTKAESQRSLRYVHSGWVSALAAGGLTWIAATYLVSISGVSRELTEGVSSVFAAMVLLFVGLWMHQKSAAGRWQAYLTEKLSAAMSRRSAFALFALAFIAVYREVFETILFYSALWVDGNRYSLLLGLLSGVVLLALAAWALLRTSARMPIGRFFQISSVFVAVLAVVLIGKGIAAMQEAGLLSISPLSWPRLEVLGMYPSAETLAAQVLVLAIVLVGFRLNTIAGRRLAAARSQS